VSDGTPAAGIAGLRVALVGYGEVGGTFGAALASGDAVRSVAAFDVLVADASWTPRAQTRADRDGVALARDIGEAVDGADLVISAVTAPAAGAAAEAIAQACRPGAFVLDVNSATPHTKMRSADTVNRAGGRYIEAAVMSAVLPHGLRAPMLLGGPHAETALPLMTKLGFNATIGAATYGVVSAIKLCRSVVIKGMEALAIESLLTARRYGVEREVLKSLGETFPGLDWERQATYFWRRVAQHGKRRADEMRGAAATVGDAGIEPRMAAASADVQARIAALAAAGAFAEVAPDAGWRDLADCVKRRS
jgi:3-hydroxyisobutyrate dehydrogenase-like beta-hydroxyacid dehydrogenase